MATLLIIASLGLNVALLVVISIMASSFIGTVNHRDRSLAYAFEKFNDLLKKFRGHKRTLSGRILIPHSDFQPDFLKAIDISGPRRANSGMISRVIDPITESIAELIAEELKAHPQYIDIVVSRNHEQYCIQVDFNFDFILEASSRIVLHKVLTTWETMPDHIQKPRIINTHF